MRLLVLGAGAAGTAAVWRASRQAEVTVVHTQAGATELYCGAIDDRSWGEIERVRPIDASVTAFVTALGGWSFAPEVSLFATHTGGIRAARGGDSALLNLAPFAGRRIGVADLGRSSYLASEIAWALGKTRWAERTHTSFVPWVEAVNNPDAALSDHDFAALHDEPQALQRLGERLSKSGTLVDAWLLPPSLGLRGQARHALEEQLGAPVGEHMGLPGGPSGARFEICRNELFSARGVRVHRERVAALEPHLGGFRVRYAARYAVDEVYDRVVLAVGGVVSGGIQLGQPRRESPSSLAFELGLKLAAPLRMGEQEIDRVSSLHGFDPAQSGFEALEQVGIGADHGVLADLPGLFLAGDIIAGRPRTVLEAARSGCKAADLALS